MELRIGMTVWVNTLRDGALKGQVDSIRADGQAATVGGYCGDGVFQNEYELSDILTSNPAQPVIQAAPTREKVGAGQYKIGDVLNGHAIVNFGKAWRETEAGTWGKRGTLYQDCRHCGTNTAVDIDSELCQKCGANGEDVTVCYAYFK